MDHPTAFPSSKSVNSPKSKFVQLIVPGMGSNHCAGLITTSVERLPGIISLTTNIANHRVQVEFDAKLTSDNQIRSAIEKAGYDVDSITSIPSRKIGEAVFMVPGMGSDHCAGLVSSSVKRLAGITDTSTNIANHKVTVRFDVATVDAERIKVAIEKAGYEVAGVSESRAQADTAVDEAVEERYLDQAWKRLWFAAIPTTLIMVLMMVHMLWVPVSGYLAWVALLGFPVVFLRGGWATHRSSWRSLTNRTANMDVLISMGSLPPYLIGLVGFVYPMTSFIEMATTIMTFHMLGRYLETRAKGRASQAIKKLLKLGAKTASVLRDGQEVEVPVAELQVGDIMVVRPGAKVPTDGEIVEGSSHLDESIATGESVPVEKGPGDGVIGATINKEGMLQVRATRVGADTFLSQVVGLVEQAQGSKVPIQEFADKLTAKFVPGVIVISLTSLVVWVLFAEPLRPILYWGAEFLPWVNPELSPLMLGVLAAISVLVIACPCALGLATPTAIMVGSGLGAESGVLIRSGEAIQSLKDIKAVVLDKTGTITKGEPALTDVIATADFNEADVLRFAASVEAGSEHPLGQSIVEGAREKNLEVPTVRDFRAITARGVEGRVDDQLIRVGSRRLLNEADIELSDLEEALVRLEKEGKTAMLVAVGHRAAGIVAVADTIKEDSKAAIAALHQLGIHTVMITGDNERTARHVADQVGIDEVLAGVLPEGKVDAIKKLQDKYGQLVAMVGDGINDAPALKQANVGIAIGAGADVAIEAADVTLVKGELSKVVEAIRLSRATFRKIVENLFWAWFYNLAAIPIAAVGLLHPMIGVIAMTISSLSVIGNSLRLKRVKLNVDK
ncbi:heavy metal translocating P-type ATPase [Pseudohongiella sp. SYSU M77423]|uniref:heavy metal translocating P-type ATPase n=1 Tax=Pseudohongiella sp. SYSU M77423 TaxID=3042312 RepID=UPI000C916330|nr:heavy metal translocating P-type ATPase [Pseudohongiella sp. SYSU M77423]MAY54235.1 heavy metal translocating P-type ATPase [Gammaproteobacteria bacterium]MDH7942214.1 heavy metal translocating P-type ATPase [Pseudohongiella sp. SYSU M77423]